MWTKDITYLVKKLTTGKYYDQGKKRKLKCSKVNEALVKICSGKEYGKEKFSKNAVKGYG